MTALEIEETPLDRITEYPNNPRVNSGAISAVARSIREFGFRQPIVVDAEGVIIAGHTRFLAAKELGLETVPVHWARGMTPTQAQGYRIADNKTHELAEWDWSKLSAELTALRDRGASAEEMEALGFDPAELRHRLQQALHGQDPEHVPDLLPDANVTEGDVWLLGSHRLACGDCTDAAVVEACLGQEKPHLMVTDPPYGVEYDPDWRNRADRANGKPYGARAVGTVQNDERSDWREAWSLFGGDVAYVWHAGRHASAVQGSLEAAGLEVRSQIIWAKDRLIISRGDYHWQHEPCWYAVRKDKKGHWSGDRSQTTLWQIEHRKSDTGHGTQKPIECMKRPIENNSKIGDGVYDPFVGSGTTIMAAELTGRHCFAVEVNPDYVGMAIRRWQGFTGQTAILESTGEPYDSRASR